MKKLFLTSSFADCKELFSDFIWEDLHWKIVTFIPTAWVVEEDIFFIDDDKRAFESLWVTIDELEISTENIENIKQKLEKNDFIFVSWWNTFFLLQELKKNLNWQIDSWANTERKALYKYFCLKYHYESKY